MIRLEHFTNDNFNSLGYLLDCNPGKSITSSEIKIDSNKRNQFNSLMIDELKYNVLTSYYYNNISCIRVIYSYDGKTIQLSIIYIPELFNLEDFKEKIKEFIYVKEELNLPKINFIAINEGEPYLIERNLPKEINIDVENSYNLSYSLNDIIKDVTSDKSGLMLFTGDPGTGKTSLIKYLSQINKDIKFCFLSNSNLDILSSPNFTEFCMNKLQNSVIVLEDCEKALLTRDMNKGYDISNILNMTDGIYGDILNIKVIATLNTDDKIDSALLRKGRLICKSKFNKLSIEQAQNMANKLNKDIIVSSEMALCEIYNIENTGVEEKTKSSVGFNF